MTAYSCFIMVILICIQTVGFKIVQNHWKSLTFRVNSREKCQFCKKIVHKHAWFRTWPIYTQVFHFRRFFWNFILSTLISPNRRLVIGPYLLISSSMILFVSSMDLSSSFYITVYWNPFVSEKYMLEFSKKKCYL